MDTTRIDDSVSYSTGYASKNELACCFIDADNMTVRSVFNIGTLEDHGHADNVAAITLKQKQIAEWLEDWKTGRLE